ncbi:MAG: hypothetical protein JXK05_12705 [Campylobacterales bacterium]|nr:hypothetical protein [Campylobacterales bacterium]
MGDFGKFLLLKHLFAGETIALIWYLYPDEIHNTDGSHTVEERNANVYRHCFAIDAAMSECFNAIHQHSKRHVTLFETHPPLAKVHYFKEAVVGEGAEYRKDWLTRALAFIRKHHARVVCLDPDNGVEPASMQQLSIHKQGKYASYAEIEAFFELEEVAHLLIYQHFHRQCSHELQMQKAKERFENLYEGRLHVTIIRHNPVQARFYIMLSKPEGCCADPLALEGFRYGAKAFFSVFQSELT